MNADPKDGHIKHLEGVLKDILFAWEHRSELYRSESDCAAGMADWARKSLKESKL